MIGRRPPEPVTGVQIPSRPPQNQNSLTSPFSLWFSQHLLLWLVTSLLPELIRSSPVPQTFYTSWKSLRPTLHSLLDSWKITFAATTILIWLGKNSSLLTLFKLALTVSKFLRSCSTAKWWWNCLVWFSHSLENCKDAISVEPRCIGDLHKTFKWLWNINVPREEQWSLTNRQR